MMCRHCSIRSMISRRATQVRYSPESAHREGQDRQKLSTSAQLDAHGRSSTILDDCSALELQPDHDEVCRASRPREACSLK